MITDERSSYTVHTVLFFDVQNCHCSLSDMILSARDSLMITNDSLQ